MDGAAITQSDVEQEYKLEHFLQHGRVPAGVPTPDVSKVVLNRLIDQRLLAGELEAQGFATEDVLSAVNTRLTEIRRTFRNDAAFRAVLSSLGVDENGLRLKLETQTRILHMTEHRMRPEAKPSLSEVEAYYSNSFLPQFAKRGKGPAPALSEVEDQIVEVLVQKKIDALLEDWIKQLRAAHQVKIFPGGP